MESLGAVFTAFIEKIEDTVSMATFNTWFRIMRPESFSGRDFVISVPTGFQKGIIENVWMPTINEALESTIGFVPNVSIVSQEETPEEKAAAPSQGDQFTFENFVVGPSNRFAYSAAMAVANKPGGNYNPLFIHGSSGLGKTHLLWAIHNELKKNHPEMNLICVRGEEFTNEMYACIQNKNMEAFHDKYRSADVLFMDDIHFIAGRESTQEEFFNTFNILYQDHKQVVVTSDRPPKDIQRLDERIRSRMVNGLLADVSQPDLDTKIAIIQKKATLLEFELPTDVVLYIAQQIKSNIRQIEGTVKKLYAYRQLTGQQPTREAAKTAISDIRNDDMPTPASMDRIVEEVARTYNVSREDMLSKNQSKNVSFARKAAIYIIRESLNLTLDDIGEYFHRDHATVVYSLKSFTALLEKNKAESTTVQDIIANLANN